MDVRENKVYGASPFRSGGELQLIDIFSDEIADAFTHSPKMLLIDLAEKILIPGIDFEIKDFVEDVHLSWCMYEDKIPKDFWKVDFVERRGYAKNDPIYRSLSNGDFEATWYNTRNSFRLTKKDPFLERKGIPQPLVYPPRMIYNMG